MNISPTFVSILLRIITNIEQQAILIISRLIYITELL